MVFNLALQYVQNIQVAEEITQDVFLKIHNKRSKFNNASTLKTWIYRITINTSLDFLKAKQRSKRVHFFQAKPFEDDHQRTSQFNHPGIQLESKEALKQIFNGLNQLAGNQKTVIILLKIDGRSTKEVAAIMELSPKAVESLFQRAKKNLNLILQQNEGFN